MLGLPNYKDKFMDGETMKPLGETWDVVKDLASGNALKALAGWTGRAAVFGAVIGLIGFSSRAPVCANISPGVSRRERCWPKKNRPPRKGWNVSQHTLHRLTVYIRQAIIAPLNLYVSFS